MRLTNWQRGFGQLRLLNLGLRHLSFNLNSGLLRPVDLKSFSSLTFINPSTLTQTKQKQHNSITVTADKSWSLGQTKSRSSKVNRYFHSISFLSAAMDSDPITTAAAEAEPMETAVTNSGKRKRVPSDSSNSNMKTQEETPIAITKEMKSKWRSDFYKDPKNVLALQACIKHDPLDVCISRSAMEDTNNVFTHKVEQEGKPVCNQKSSGRCWLFAFLNSARVPFMKKLNIDEFEFSQSYLFFWDKLERCNHHLNNVVKAWKQRESVDGRLMSFLLKDPISDGGQWGMLVNLVREYGLMPKNNFPESFSSESSGRLNVILRSKLREFSKQIRDNLDATNSVENTEKLIQFQMSQLYQIIGICLGIPKDEFVWEYYDKTKVYHKIGPITPIRFYEELVKPVYDVETKVCLTHDPRPENPFGRAYIVNFLGNMVNGEPTVYNNQPMEVLLHATTEAIKNGDLVWFGCEVSKRFAAKPGIEDLKIHDYASVFGVDVTLGMDKAARLLYGESCMSHAMVFTAVSIETDEATGAQVPTKFRVENSWGEEKGDKGYLVMTADWFKEFVFEVVIDKKHLPADVIEVSAQEPVVLPAWDPMGTLACKNWTNGGGEQ